MLCQISYFNILIHSLTHHWNHVDGLYILLDLEWFLDVVLSIRTQYYRPAATTTTTHSNECIFIKMPYFLCFSFPPFHFSSHSSIYISKVSFSRLKKLMASLSRSPLWTRKKVVWRRKKCQQHSRKYALTLCIYIVHCMIIPP